MHFTFFPKILPTQTDCCIVQRANLAHLTLGSFGIHGYQDTCVLYEAAHGCI